MKKPFPDDFSDLIDPEEEIDIPQDVCCICLGQPVKHLVEIQEFTYPFCAGCEHRAMLLMGGKKHGWPAIRIDGSTGKYALGNDASAYVLTATSGTNGRVVELIDALDEYEQGQSPAA